MKHLNLTVQHLESAEEAKQLVHRGWIKRNKVPEHDIERRRTDELKGAQPKMEWQAAAPHSGLFMTGHSKYWLLVS